MTRIANDGIILCEPAVTPISTHLKSNDPALPTKYTHRHNSQHISLPKKGKKSNWKEIQNQRDNALIS